MPENKGYYNKFTVIRNSTGEEVTGRTFTLLLDEDPHARPALQAYIDSIAADGSLEEAVAGLQEVADSL